MEPNNSWDGCTKMATLSPERRSALSDDSLVSLLKRIRIHPEAQRILGNSCIAIVRLERLKTPVPPQQTQSFTAVQPIVPLKMIHCQPHPALQNIGSQSSLEDFSCQNASNPNISEIEEVIQAHPPPPPQGLSDSNPPSTAALCWTEPYCPDSSLPASVEHDSGFACEAHLDNVYIDFESDWNHQVKTDIDLVPFDVDPEQEMVIQVDPGPKSSVQEMEEQDVFLVLEEDVVSVEMEESGDQRDRGSPAHQGAAVSRQPSAGQRESDDFCAVCLIGGELLCCDHCPKVYHVSCHVPPVISFPLGNWLCTLCRTDQHPAEEAYECENTHSCDDKKTPYSLSIQHQRRCEKMTLLLLCHVLSAPFHEPVSPLARNYYQIIKRPIDLSMIRRKLDKSNTLHYFTPEQFVDDILLMFKNCAIFNYPDSEVAHAGRNLEVFFLDKLREVFYDQTFPAANQERTDQARLRWLNRKRKESHRKKRRVFSGKRYYL